MVTHVDDREVPDTLEDALAQGGIFADPLARALGRSIPHSYAKDPAWRAATAAQLGVTDSRYLPGAKRGGR